MLENKMNDTLNTWITKLNDSLNENKISKINLGNYKGEEKNLKKCIIRPILIKSEIKLSFTFQYATRDIIKNYSVDEGLSTMIHWLNNREFNTGVFFTELENFTIQSQMNKNWKLTKSNNSKPQKISIQHNIPKNRSIDATSKQYLHELGLTNPKGEIYNKAQDKFKQINHYIEILSPVLKNISREKPFHIADMGSGKGYLTFALYDYLKNNLNKNIFIKGIEYREDLVQLCNKIASNNHMSGLNFEQGTIESYRPSEKLDMIIALHACDTATDDAIFKGIEAKSSLIVVAPCCHKQIRREMENSKTITSINFLTQYGIFLERQAEMITDGLRAKLLEYMGYKVKVIEFISDLHTPKNVLIIAERTKHSEMNTNIWNEIQTIKNSLGIQSHYLENLIKNSYHR